MTILARTRHAFVASESALDRFSPVVDLVIRMWVANVFWKSGMTKIASWDSTVYLFRYEYSVPLLSAETAAFMGTAVELTLPILLFIGLGTRFSAIALFIFNIIAVISYPVLQEIGYKDHQYWGLLLLVTIFHGPGKLSVDYLLQKRFRHS